MKKLKYTLLSIGSLTTVSSLAFAGSCSTTWTKWNKTKNDKKTTIDYSKYVPENDARNFPESYIIRETIKKNDKAFVIDEKDQTKVTINLDYINNVNELIYVLKKILKISLTQNIDEAWDNMTDGINDNDDTLAKYIEGTISKLDIRLMLGDKTSNVGWDLLNIKAKVANSYQDIITKIKLGLNQYLQDLKNPSFKNKWFSRSKDAPMGIGQASWDIHKMKLFDVQVNGLDNNVPKDFSKVTSAAGSLINKKVVSRLLSVNANLSVKLSKLVNLPYIMFEGFSDLLDYYGVFLTNLYNNELIKKWERILHLKDESNNLIKKNGQTLLINKKDYSLKINSVNNKGMPVNNLRNKSYEYAFIGKFMDVILKKDIK